MDAQLNSKTPFQPSHLLNCCRVLTRIMPFVFESQDGIEWEKEFFWTPRTVEKENQKLPPRAHVLITCRGYNIDETKYILILFLLVTLQSLFLAGFTLPHTMATADSKVNYVIWETGVGSSTPIGSSRDNDINRTEVLKLLTVLFSKSMYTTPSHVLTQQDPWLHFMVSKTERKVVLAFLCSMINTSCKYNPMGWTAVPYNHIMYTDPREQLVALCLRTLLIVLDYRFEMEEHEETMENAFRFYLSKLHRAQDFQFLFDGIYRILSSPMQVNVDSDAYMRMDINVLG